MKTRHNKSLKIKGGRKITNKRYGGKKWIDCVKAAKKTLSKTRSTKPTLKSIKKQSLKSSRIAFGSTGYL
jgi:hypothetical protein